MASENTPSAPETILPAAAGHRAPPARTQDGASRHLGLAYKELRQRIPHLPLLG